MTDKDIDRICVEILEKDYGYVKIDKRDQWVIYKKYFLIVINPEFKPKIYKYKCKGNYYEIEPI